MVCAPDKPNGTNTINAFSLNFPQDGVVSFQVGGKNVPAPVSEEVAALAWAQFPCVPSPSIALGLRAPARNIHDTRTSSPYWQF